MYLVEFILEVRQRPTLMSPVWPWRSIAFSCEHNMLPAFILTASCEGASLLSKIHQLAFCAREILLIPPHAALLTPTR